MLLLALKGKVASCAEASMASDSQLRMGDIDGLCDSLSPPPPKSNSLDSQPLKRTLNIYDRNPEVV